MRLASKVMLMKLHKEPLIMGVSIVVSVVVGVSLMFHKPDNTATVDNVTPLPLQVGNKPVPALTETSETEVDEEQQAKIQSGISDILNSDLEDGDN